MKHLSRKEREKAQHRFEILEAAEKVFAEKGFRGATTEDIAQQAEFSVGTLYNFFGSKEELYTAVLIERVEQVLQLVTEIFSRTDLDPVRAIERYIERKAEFFTEHGPFFRLFHREQLGGSADISPSWREQVCSAHQQSIERIEAAVQRGIETGSFRNISARDVALALQGLTNGMLLDCLNSDTDYRSKVPLMKTLFFEGALAGPRSEDSGDE